MAGCICALFWYVYIWNGTSWSSVTRHVWIVLVILKVCLGRERVGGFGCYDVIKKPGGMTWLEASNYCTDMGNVLLAIDSTEENDAIKSYLQENEGKPFICDHPRHAIDRTIQLSISEKPHMPSMQLLSMNEVCTCTYPTGLCLQGWNLCCRWKSFITTVLDGVSYNSSMTS